jgi:glycosyltransferase involved in cell wall biosynthesis
MSPIRVAFDTGPVHGAKTGIGYAVESMRSALVARDDVTLHDYVLSFRADLADGTARLPLPAAMAQRLWARTAHPRVDRWLASAQVVHGTNYVVPPTRLPSVVSVYDCWFLTHPGQANPAVRRAGAVLKAAVARGAVVHTSSHATEAVVRSLFAGVTARTVHLGSLPLPAPAPTPPVPELDGRPFILAIGTLERRKNIATLVRAFGAIAADQPDLLLVLAGGGGDDVEAIATAIDELGPGHSARVLRTGRVDEPVRSWLLRHAVALAYPSLDEGFGFPLLDAMQAGTPVVASTSGSIPEVAGDAALLCEATDHEALAAALLTAVTDDGERARLTTAGALRWHQFEWERCAADLVDVYRRVVQGETDDWR